MSGDQQPVGLCAQCVHARSLSSSRGSTFWLCGLSQRDPRFAKYPRLPVHSCEGFTRDPAERPDGTPNTGANQR